MRELKERGGKAKGARRRSPLRFPPSQHRNEKMRSEKQKKIVLVVWFVGLGLVCGLVLVGLIFVLVWFDFCTLPFLPSFFGENFGSTSPKCP